MIELDLEASPMIAAVSWSRLVRREEGSEGSG